MKSKLSVLFIFVLILGGIYAVKPAECVNLYIDFGDKKVSQCITAGNNTPAYDILESGKIEVEGTNKYGLQVICRVNGFPSREVEPCDTMPSEKAYWAIIVRDKRHIFNLFPKYGWAEVGAKDITLNPGQSFGLVFVKDGELKWPD
jgi:hypothetical protein